MTEYLYLFSSIQYNTFYSSVQHCKYLFKWAIDWTNEWVDLLIPSFNLPLFSESQNPHLGGEWIHMHVIKICFHLFCLGISWRLCVLLVLLVWMKDKRKIGSHISFRCFPNSLSQINFSLFLSFSFSSGGFWFNIRKCTSKLYWNFDDFKLYL